MSVTGAMLGRSFLKQQAAALTAASTAAMAGIATVTGITGNLVSVQRSGASTSGTQLYAHAAGQHLAIGDTVALVPLNNGSYVALKTGGDLDNLTTAFAADSWAQDTADTASTTNTVTYVQAMSRSWTLPAGTWSVMGFAFLQLKSTNANANLEFTVAGVNSVRVVPVLSTAFLECHTPANVSNLSGSVALTVNYKGAGSGTTSAQQPAAWLIAWRTAP